MYIFKSTFRVTRWEVSFEGCLCGRAPDFHLTECPAEAGGRARLAASGVEEDLWERRVVGGERDSPPDAT